MSSPWDPESPVNWGLHRHGIQCPNTGDGACASALVSWGGPYARLEHVLSSARLGPSSPCCRVWTRLLAEALPTPEPLEVGSWRVVWDGSQGWTRGTASGLRGGCAFGHVLAVTWSGLCPPPQWLP